VTGICGSGYSFGKELETTIYYTIYHQIPYCVRRLCRLS
jgi:hypothetical protein